jgi:hypothetical protein
MSYVYLLHSKVHINSGETVYKIGKTRNFPGRFQQYPKGSVVLGVWFCEDCHRTEKELLLYFRLKYESRRDAGAEYFQGDWKSMRNDIHDIVCRVETHLESKVIQTEQKDTFIVSVFQ